MKNPGDCKSIDEIREGIDEIDKQIIALFGERLKFVKSIVQFKKNEEDVKAKNRYMEVLDIRRNWAGQVGLDPDVIEQIYRMMMEYFIKVQKDELDKRMSGHKQA